jgi:hypothetical protein
MITSYLATRQFWVGALERAARCFAYVMLAVLAVPQVGDAAGIDVLHVGWTSALSYALGGALLSVLGSVAAGGSGLGPPGSPSLVNDRWTDTLRGRVKARRTT